jgi:hypothetical protein
MKEGAADCLAGMGPRRKSYSRKMSTMKSIERRFQLISMRAVQSTRLCVKHRESSANECGRQIGVRSGPTDMEKEAEMIQEPGLCNVDL